MKFAVACLLASASAYDLMDTEEYQFMSFITEQGRSFGTTAEYKFRLNVFKNRLAEHKAHNEVEGQTSTVGVNHLTDRTDEEIKQLLGFKEMPVSEDRNETLLSEENLADSMDWRAKGAVTPVKNQGQCGSCWSFSTTGAMEGAHFVATGNLVSLSEQNLVDCSWLNHGCNGGMMDLAFTYAKSHALETEAEYPYTAKSGLFACKYDKSKGAVKVSGYTDVKKSSAPQLKAALNTGPVSVAIQADQPVFHAYTGGIITGTSCGTQLDHGVLAVGYGTENGTDYYIVKNSWTAQWGEQGYVRIGIEDGAGVCGIQSQPSYPTTN